MVTPLSSKDNVASDLDQADIYYLDPTPVRIGKLFYISVLVRNGKNSDKQYIQSRTVIEIIKSNTNQGYMERHVVGHLIPLTLKSGECSVLKFSSFLPSLTRQSLWKWWLAFRKK
jgi:hypothetical protein